MTYDPNRPLNPTATEREFDHTADKAKNTLDKAADSASNLVDKAGDKANQAASAVTDKVNDLKDQFTSTDAGQKAVQVAGDVKERVTVVAGQAVEKADAATNTVGSKMQDAASMLREKAPTEGAVGQAAVATADTLERAGSYLQQQDIVGMRSDLETLIRNHPTESLLIAFGAGFLLARSTRR